MANLHNLTELKKKVENLDEIHHKKILEIFLKNNIAISENRNGCFINISNLNKNITSEIYDFLKYINKQEKTLSDVEQIKIDFKKNFFTKSK
jgi:hypothetical protein